MENDVAVAERLAGKRAILFLLMAALLIGGELIALEDVEKPSHLALWLVMVALFALNLTPVGGWLVSARVKLLLNDETTREHRRTSFAAGFWAGLAAAAIIAVVATYQPLSGPVVARVIITAAISAALISFGIQEQRAVA